MNYKSLILNLEILLVSKYLTALPIDLDTWIIGYNFLLTDVYDVEFHGMI